MTFWTIEGYVFAAENTISIDETMYEEILNEINEEYNLDLGFFATGEEGTLEEYEQETRKFAAQQRELLNYIELREKMEEKICRMFP